VVGSLGITGFLFYALPMNSIPTEHENSFVLLLTIVGVVCILWFVWLMDTRKEEKFKILVFDFSLSEWKVLLI
jgi:hypothetical protein